MTTKTLLAALVLSTSGCFSQASFTLPSSICTGNSTTVTASSGTDTPFAWSWTVSPSGPQITAPLASVTAISFSSAGTYSVTLTIGGTGGTSTATHTISVMNSPTLSVIQSQFTICPGHQVTFTASGAASYVWSPAATLSQSLGPVTTAQPTSSAVYTVIGSNASCSTTATVSVTMGQFPLVNVSASPAFTVCEGSTMTLTASGAITYTWLSAVQPSVASQSITGGAGSYTAVGSNGGSCLGYNWIVIGTGNCTGIGEEEFAGARVYPNPFTDRISITGPSGVMTIEVLDISGRVLLTTKISESTEVRIESLPTGYYFLRITDAKSATKIIRLVKQ
jgi:hypothetical protein